MTAARGRRRTAAPVEPEVEELDDVEELEDLEDAPADAEVDELEELEDEPEPEPAPKRGRRAAAKTAPATKAPAKKAAAPAKSTTAAAPAAEASGYNSAWLAEHVNEQTGSDYDARTMRVLLRRMAQDGDLDREIGADRGRYDFPKGAADPTVRKVVARVKRGDAAPAKKVAEPVEETAPAPRKRTAAKKTPAKATKSASTARRGTRA